MCTWRQTFAIIEERDNNVTLQNDTRQISSIKIGDLMNSVLDTFHFTDMTVDMAFLSWEILSFRLRKSAEHVKHSACQIAPQKVTTSRQIGWTGWPKMSP